MNAKDVTILTEALKIMVVGSYGTGKSTFASTCPTPGFVFNFDDRIVSYEGLDFDYEDYSMDWKGWVKFEKDILTVKKGVIEEKYKSVIVDSTTTMTDLAMERALQLDPKRSETGGPIWNIHYMMVRNLIEGRLRQIIKEFPCDVILISHIDVKTDQKTGNIIDIVPLLTGQLAEKIPGYCDEVYYATTRRKENKTEFLLQTVPIGLTKARSVLSGRTKRLPDFVPNNYNSIINHLQKQLKKEVKAKS